MNRTIQRGTLKGAHAMWMTGAAEGEIERWVRWVEGRRIYWPEIVAAFNAAHFPATRRVPKQAPFTPGPAFCETCGLRAARYTAKITVRFRKVVEIGDVICNACAALQAAEEPAHSGERQVE